ncbi:MAG TPA: GNAT family N-acetyltransferase [Polyangiaceae bacterium]|nr:GNAT family N-acetyltransferase [Polyangiaceae bacterium]
MLELEFVPSIEAVGAAVFSELEGPETYPFLRYAWLSALEGSGSASPERGWIPRHAVLRRGAQIVAVCPGYVKTNSFGEFVFDHAIADFAESRLGLRYYPKWIAAVPFTPASGPRVLFVRGSSPSERAEWLERLAELLPSMLEDGRLSSLHLLFPGPSQLDGFVSSGWALRAGLQFQFHNSGLADFEGFLAGFRAKTRAMIRRERRELAQGPLRIEELTGARLRELDPELVHRLYLTTVDKFVWGRRYLTRDFFARVLAEMPDNLQIIMASEQGEPVAGAFNLLGTEALYGRYWGAFREVKYLHFEVCLYRGVESTIARGLSRFEPGAGGEHKEGRGFAPTLTWSLHHFADARLDGAVRDYFAREREALEMRSLG